MCKNYKREETVLPQKGNIVPLYIALQPSEFFMKVLILAQNCSMVHFIHMVQCFLYTQLVLRALESKDEERKANKSFVDKSAVLINQDTLGSIFIDLRMSIIISVIKALNE